MFLNILVTVQTTINRTDRISNHTSAAYQNSSKDSNEHQAMLHITYSSLMAISLLLASQLDSHIVL